MFLAKYMIMLDQSEALGFVTSHYLLCNILDLILPGGVLYRGSEPPDICGYLFGTRIAS